MLCYLKLQRTDVVADSLLGTHTTERIDGGVQGKGKTEPTDPENM